jgi:hypothetical protein
MEKRKHYNDIYSNLQQNNSSKSRKLLEDDNNDTYINKYLLTRLFNEFILLNNNKNDYNKNKFEEYFFHKNIIKYNGFNVDFKYYYDNNLLIDNININFDGLCGIIVCTIKNNYSQLYQIIYSNNRYYINNIIIFNYNHDIINNNFLENNEDKYFIKTNNIYLLLKNMFDNQQSINYEKYWKDYSIITINNKDVLYKNFDKTNYLHPTNFNKNIFSNQKYDYIRNGDRRVIILLNYNITDVTNNILINTTQYILFAYSNNKEYYIVSTSYI